MSRSSNVTHCFTSARPSQNPIVPLAASHCQNGSRIRVSCSGEIPAQVSEMVREELVAVIVTVHHAGVNLAALSNKLLKIRSTIP